MEPANILFLIAFVGLPLAIGIWALVTRRDILRRGTSSRRRGQAPPPQRPQSAPPLREVEYGPRAQETIEIRRAEPPAQETTPIPQRDWASSVQPVRRQATQPVVPARRQFYPPRYVGRAGGVVKRVTPRAARSFLRLRSSNIR